MDTLSNNFRQFIGQNLICHVLRKYAKPKTARI